MMILSLRTFHLVALSALLLWTRAEAQAVSSRMSTQFLARGEKVLLEIAVTGGRPTALPVIPEIQNITLMETGRGPLTNMITGRRLEYVFQYVVTGYDIGDYVIPQILVNVDGEPVKTQPLQFQIFNPDDLKWEEVVANGQTIRYASAFRTLNSSPYENQTIAAEIKVFVPQDLVIEDWGIPDFERDGVAAWRFQPLPTRSMINLLGRPYISVAYPSTVTPTRSGSVGIGPAKVRLTTREVIGDPFARQVNAEVYIHVPKLALEALKLPEGAPEGFKNAVGDFQLTAKTEGGELQEGDPISVELKITGSGNLDTLQPPALENSAGWKVYPTTTDQRGDERREISGTVVFRQAIRPLQMKSEIPPFRLVYFEPGSKEYKVLTTAPIPLQMRPSTAQVAGAAAVVNSLPMPIERMTDILEILPPTFYAQTSTAIYSPWMGHVLGGFLALLLIVRALWIRVAWKFRKNPLVRIKLRELAEIERAKNPDEKQFLRATGNFIEKRLGNSNSPELAAVIEQRDTVCFRNDEVTRKMDAKRRAEILATLRKAVVSIAILVTALAGTVTQAATPVQKANKAFESANYEESIKLWLGSDRYDRLSADTLYNIGNACYRMDSPGYAALYYRRALARDSGHQEALQNLRFLERKFGSITVQRPTYQFALTRLPLDTWKNLFWAGAWGCLLGILVFPATRPGAKSRAAGMTLATFSPLVASVGLLGWWYFPSDAKFAPAARQAVVVRENVVLHTDAARTSPEVIDAPPGSLCQIIRQSEEWIYVSFATKTRGWVLKQSIEPVIPREPPTVPKFTKPTSDGKSA